MLVGDPAALGQGRRPRGRAPGLQPRLRRVRRPPDPRRDPGHQRGRAEGRHLPRLPARGRHARRRSAAATSASTTRSGACSPEDFTGWDERTTASATAELLADGGAAADERRLLPLRRVPRGRGRHPHAARSRPAGARRCAADRPRDRRAAGLDAISPYGYPGRRSSTARPAAGRRRGRLERRPGWSASSSATASAAAPWLAGAPERSPRPSSTTRRRRAAAAPAARRADPRQRARGLGGRARSPGPTSRGGRPRRLRRRLRADDAPRRGRRALLLRPRVLRRRALASSAAGCRRPRATARSAPRRSPRVSDGFLHYFLGGTADARARRSPFKNVVAAMLDLADELGLPLNLGGGVSPGDGLEEFKRGFANAELAVPHPRGRLRPGARTSGSARRPRRRRVLPRLPRRLSARATAPPPGAPSAASAVGGSVGRRRRARRTARSAPGPCAGSPGSRRRARRPGRR